MTPQHVISQLLESDTKYPNNLNLLKKIIVAAQLGRLQINGLPPDNKISLANYLFDNEGILFDFTRLCEEQRKAFTHWLLGAHQQDKSRAHFRGTSVNEYRGFTAESFLSWWGMLKNWLKKKHSDYWKITDLTLSLHYQLTGIEMFHGEHGILIGFDQFLAPVTGTKYHESNDSQKEPLGNTKRVFITDRLVEQLIECDLQKQPFEAICKKPHPQSIHVFHMHERLGQMYDYRNMQRFLALQPWYIRMWTLLFPWLREGHKSKSKPMVDNHLLSLYQSDTIHIEQYSKTFEILVKERRPEIENIVYCGGGAKIFGHVGFWNALNDANIHPSKFAGSSAGAIMALLCYLGYVADEIAEFFKNFRQEHLIHFDININGISDTHSLKTALDYAIAYKLELITTKYKIPYPEGKITFATLETIRKQCPECGLGTELVVTATNKRLQKTRYFSLHRSPTFEVSEAVKISASFPIVYRSTSIDGEEHNDGGILTNFPTEAFFDDFSTLLESEYGNNLKVLAVQFDNGTERTAIDKMMKKVYKENFFINWIYRLLTGVNDPASGWEQDRLKLRKYSSQSIVINVNKISSSSFSVDEKSRLQMIQAGYDATMSYLNARYIKDEKGNYQNDEFMYTKFSSISDLLSYCCYRGNHHWFELVGHLIAKSNLPDKTDLLTQVEELKVLHFKSKDTLKSNFLLDDNPITFFGNTVPQEPLSQSATEKHKILLAVYPVLLKLAPELLKDSTDKKIFDYARHSFTLHSPFACLEHFAKMSNSINVVLHIVINLIKELRDNSCQKIYDEFKEVLAVLKNHPDLYKEEYYGIWSLSLAQSIRTLHLLNGIQPLLASHLLKSLVKGEEPMQTIIAGRYCDDFSDLDSEESSSVLTV